MSTEKQQRWLADIIENIDRITYYVDGLDRHAFAQDQKTIDAVERCLQRISEAGIRLDDWAKEWMPMHSWNSIRKFGNFLRHHYDAVKPELLWQTIMNELPALHHDCSRVLAQLQKGEEREQNAP